MTFFCMHAYLLTWHWLSYNDNRYTFIYSAICESQVATDIAEGNWNLKQTQWVYNFIRAWVTKTKEESQGLATHSRIQGIFPNPPWEGEARCVSNIHWNHKTQRLNMIYTGADILGSLAYTSLFPFTGSTVRAWGTQL